MNGTGSVESGTLDWVKAEIDQTLGRAREAIAGYTSSSEDQTPLKLYANHLHQVVGTLQMVELDGAAMLAKEAESLADAMIHKGLNGNFDSAKALLDSSLINLSSYLDKLQKGMADIPVHNLELMNKLRVVRGEAPVELFSIFDPDLEIYPSKPHGQIRFDEQSYRERAANIRRQFQVALLKWLRDHDSNALETIGGLTAELLSMARFNTVAQLWWVAGAYIELLHGEIIEHDDLQKHLPARLDQLLRKLVEGGEAAIVKERGENLIRQMLYEIGCSASNGSQVAEIKQAFKLTEILRGEADVDAREPLNVPPEVSRELEAQINTIQEKTTDYFDSEQRDPERLHEIVQDLDGVAERMKQQGGLSVLVDLTAEVSNSLKIIGDQSQSINEPRVSLRIAEALLVMEETLSRGAELERGWTRTLAVKIEQLRSSFDVDADAFDPSSTEIGQTGESGFKATLSTVAGEMHKNLEQAEESLEHYAGEPTQLSLLEDVPDNLGQVQGALRMLGEHKASEMLATAIDYLRRLVGKEIEPTPSLIDSLAVAVGTAQSFVDGLESDRPHLGEMIERANQDLEDVLTERELSDFDPGKTVAALREYLDDWLRDNANYDAFRQLRRRLREISAVANVKEQSKPRRIAQEMNNLLDIVTEDPSFMSEEIEQTLRRSLNTLEELIGDLQTFEAPLQGDALRPGQGLDVEPEILEIFREEGLECADNVDRLFEVWSSDSSDRSALTELRRQFHTLKGSGRTANAGPIAELAWVVENVLNETLESGLEVSRPLLSFVDDAGQEIRNALTDEGLGKQSIELEVWEDRADRILLSKKPELVAPITTGLAEGAGAEREGDEQIPSELEVGAGAEREGDEQIPSELEVGAGAEREGDEQIPSELEVGAGAEQQRDEQTPPELDEVVVRIFTQETLEHISTIRNFLGAQTDKVSPELARAVHTLRGTSRSLHLVEMSNVFHALDDRLSAADSTAAGLTQADLDFLDRAAILAASTLDRLNNERTFPAALRQQFDELRDEVVSLDKAALEPGQEEGAISLQNISMLGDLVSKSEVVDTASNETDVAFGDEDGFDDDLIPLKDVFCEESTDVLSRINSTLEEWRNGMEQALVIPQIKRDLHTLKGSARAAGFDVIGDLSHQTETLLEKTENGLPVGNSELLALLEEAHDTLSQMVNRIDRGAELDEEEHLKKQISELINNSPQPGDAETSADDSAAELDAEGPAQSGKQDEESVLRVVDNIAAQQPPPTAAAVTTELNVVPADGQGSVDLGRNMLRVNTSLLDKLVNYAGEVSITRAQMEEQLNRLRMNLGDLRNNVSRFTQQLRELDLQTDLQIRAHPIGSQQTQDDASTTSEFDPLQLDRYTKLQQLSRGLSESLDDLVMIQTGIGNFLHQSESVLQQQSQLSSELQDGLMSTRLVPFSTLTPKLRHQARQTARELEKTVELSVVGGDVEIDRKVLDGISEALDHMIRNALDHGIEDPEHREKQGKPRSGAILINCRQQGNEVAIRFSDDGAGLNVDQIRKKAVDSALIRDTTTLTDQEVIQLIVLPGFTTATNLTQLSGRGVGMDVVHNAVRRLGGSINVESEPGKGTTFVINLPLSLSITQALFVRCGSQEFGISLNVIQSVMKVDSDDLDTSANEGGTLFEHEGRVYPLIDLPQRLGLTISATEQQRVPILIVRMGAREVAIKVSELLSTQEVVVKAMGSHISRMDGIAGATVRGDGSVVLILDLAGLWLADERQGVTDSAALIQAQHPPLIMVVDDSLTVRKVTGRNLSRHGMEVVMAKDGLDALEQMKVKLPDLMLVDIEMPRMDGYELTRNVRGNPETQHIPIVVITSRAGTRHKEKAMALGANGYLTKPYQEDELIENVGACLSKAQSRAATE